MRCVICKQPGELVVLAGKQTGVVACGKHRAAIEVTANVGGAALKAGLIAFMDRKAPGLYDSLSSAVRAFQKARDHEQE